MKGAPKKEVKKIQKSVTLSIADWEYIDKIPGKNIPAKIKALIEEYRKSQEPNFW